MKFNNLAWCLGLLFAASTCFAQMYTVTDLGTLGGSSWAAGINASGQVAGTSQSDSPADVHPFRTAPNSPINPNTDDLIGPCSTYPFCVSGGIAYGINNSGQVVGMAFLGPQTDFPAFRTTPNGLITAQTVIDSGIVSFATNINDHGEVVVVVEDAAYADSFRVAPNAFNDRTDYLGTLAPELVRFVGPGTYASAINNSGQVVGSSEIAPFPAAPVHAFRTAPESPINPATDDLGTLGGSSSSATHINAFGQVVGWSYISGDAAIDAFRTAPNAPINLETDDLGPGSATSIDDYGQVVGSTGLYSNGVWHDLNNFISAGSSCTQVAPIDINDAGQIAANGNCSGQQHAVRLDPIYRAFVQQAINADGSSVFSAKRGVVAGSEQLGWMPYCVTANFTGTSGILGPLATALGLLGRQVRIPAQTTGHTVGDRRRRLCV